MSNTTETVSLSNFRPLPRFMEECEREGTATKNQILWWIRYRYENGLMSSGAIIEKRPNPKSRRPILFVNQPRFIDWLTISSEEFDR